MLSDAQHAAAQAALSRTGASGDSVSFAQVLAAAGAGGLQKNKYADAIRELLGADVVTRKTSKGMVVEGFRVAAGAQLSAAALAAFDEPAVEPSDVRPYVPLRRVALEDIETRTAGTTLTAGARLEGVRRQMGAPASSVEERLARLEATQEALLEAVEKINGALRKYRDTFNQHVDVLDVTQAAVETLQYNVGVLHHDVLGLYGQ